MHPTLEPKHCTDDDCYIADVPTSFAFTFGARIVFVLCDEGHYPPLKQKMTETYDLASIDPCGDRFRITMTGTSGKQIVFYMTSEGVSKAVWFAETALDMQHFYVSSC